LLLLMVPGAMATVAGLPKPQHTLYARLLGAMLVGVGLAIVLEGSEPTSTGLGAGGAFAVNCTGALVLAVLLVFGRLDLPVRGRIVTWTVVGLLGLMGLTQLAYASV
jgi:fluoride ion exporter CrcB/FEX